MIYYTLSIYINFLLFPTDNSNKPTNITYIAKAMIQSTKD